MSETNNNNITVSELRTYLYSLEHEKNKQKAKEIHEYKMKCSLNEQKPKDREIAKIEKAVEKEFDIILKIKDEIVELLDECKEIPIDIEKLELAEYMLYRVDIRKAERFINKISTKLARRCNDIQEKIIGQIGRFPELEEIENIDYSEYETDGSRIRQSKEQYKLEFTEEERNELIKKELETVDKAIEFNSIPIPHEILKNSDRDIQSKMQRFNTIRQKRIRVLNSMKDEYKKLIDPREILCVIDDAISAIDGIKDVLTRSEYNTVKGMLIRRRKRIYRGTNDIRAVINAKEKKTGITNFNIQEARYSRMENLRSTITEATNQIRENPITESEEQLEKLKISYEREKQFASVIEKLNDGRPGGANIEVRAYEEQISNLEYKISRSKRIVAEAQDRIKVAKQELLILWKMEINATVSKKKDMLELGAGKTRRPAQRSLEVNKRAFVKLKKSSRGKHACT